MRIPSYILMSITFFLVLQSCVDLEDELDSINYSPKLVIEGFIVDSTGKSFVKLSLSAPDGDEVDNFPVNNAIVEITENGSSTIQFKLTQPGLYTDSLFCGKINSMYDLNVNYENQIYQASSRLLPITHLDSITYERIDSISPTDQEFKIFLYANRTSSEYTSYYKLKLTKNDSLYNDYSDLILIDDLLFSSFQKIELPYVFNSKDTVKVDIYSLNRETYTYFEELSGLTNDNLNSIYFYPQNPKNNLSNDALGIFQVSACSSGIIILP